MFIPYLVKVPGYKVQRAKLLTNLSLLGVLHHREQGLQAGHLATRLVQLRVLIIIIIRYRYSSQQIANASVAEPELIFIKEPEPEFYSGSFSTTLTVLTYFS